MFDAYSIKLVYATHKQHAPSQLYKESITYCALIDLLVEHSIHCTQSSASILTFESERDRTLASIILSSRSEYTVQCLD
jgi:hypothetical protein